jgi:hypothetical protein
MGNGRLDDWKIVLFIVVLVGLWVAMRNAADNAASLSGGFSFAGIGSYLPRYPGE